MRLGTVFATFLQGIRRSDDSLTVSPAIGGEAMNLEERMKEGHAGFFAALERTQDNGIRDLLTMYRGWGRGAADYLLEKYDPATLSPERLEAKKNAVLDTARHSIAKLPRLPESERRELVELVAKVVGTAFEARLAERRGEAGVVGAKNP